ncbi:hypothetical protein HDK64DRAFT_132625 [Phyllosticta capitalensis]
MPCFMRESIDEICERGAQFATIRREDIDAPDMREERLRRCAAEDALSRKWWDLCMRPRFAPTWPDPVRAVPGRQARPNVDILNSDIPRAERVASWKKHKKRVLRQETKWVEMGRPFCSTCGLRHPPPHLIKEQRRNAAAVERLGRGLMPSKAPRCARCSWFLPRNSTECTSIKCVEEREAEQSQRQHQQQQLERTEQEPTPPAPPPTPPLQPQETVTPATVLQSKFEPGALENFALMAISPPQKRKREDESDGGDEQPAELQLSAFKKRKKEL